jgi:signal peptidase I
VFIGLAVGVMATFALLRVFGLIRPFNVPTTAMSPAASPGDHVLAEGFSYLSGKPRRGDIVVFRAQGIPQLTAGFYYTKRIAGEPGDHVQIFAGKLYINDQRVVLSNGLGEILYPLPQGAERMSPQTDVIVPAGHYYVLGDNSTNSSDSRFWGCLPANNIVGRVAFCYWPPKRVSTVK